MARRGGNQNPKDRPGDVRGATEAWPGMLVETLRRHLADRLQAGHRGFRAKSRAFRV